MSLQANPISPPVPPELERTSCPLCGSGNSQVKVQVCDYACGIPGQFSVETCRDCQHLFLNPRPTAATLHRCYPEGYGPHQSPPPRPDQPPSEDNDASASASALHPPEPWYLKYLPLRRVPGLKSLYYWLTEDQSQPLPVLPTSTRKKERPAALELGCSTGGYLAALAQAGWDVVGVEPSSQASEKARQAGFLVHTGILDDAPLEPDSFHCVAGWMVVEHVIDPVATLKHMFHLLKPGGQLLISIPNVGCWEPTVFGTSWYLWEAPRHLNHFNPRRIREVLQNAGFVRIRIVHQKNILNVIGSLGIVLRRFKWTRGLGRRIFTYPDSPRMWIQLALSPFAVLLSLLRQGGRLTVLAERPDNSAPHQQPGAETERPVASKP